MATMITIPGGTFALGDRRPGRQPKVIVVDPFLLSDVAVPLSEWRDTRDLANANGYSIASPGAADGANHPTQRVNAYDCAAWCNAMSERTGRTPAYGIPGGGVYRDSSGRAINFDGGADGFRLPSEPEWEWAAREAGTLNGDGLSGSVNWRGTWPWTSTAQPGVYSTQGPDWTNGPPRTVQVEAGSPNSLGVYHMVGNVWEWVQHMIKDPRGEYDDDTADSRYAVIRGGSCWSLGAIARANTREVARVSMRLPYLGFRVARG